MKFKKLASLFLAVVMIFCVFPSGVTVSAATTGTTGGCTRTLDGTVLTISGEGAMADYTSSMYGTSSPWDSSLTEVIIEDGVTYIGTYAFYNCSKLKSIDVPNSVKQIGNYAFRGCSNIESMTLPFIGKSATDTSTDYSYLGYIFGSGGYTSNTSYIPDTLKSITISDGCTSIPSNAFYKCDNITSVTLSDSITSIGDHAFYGCTGLTSITLPNALTSIGGSTFYNCGSLTSIKLPDTLTSIGSNAFYGCSKIQNIVVPDSVTSIGVRAFYLCNSLESITLPFVGQSETSEDYTRHFGSIFNYTVYAGYSASRLQYNDSYYEFTIPSSLKEVIITRQETVPESAFYGCGKIERIVLPNTITSIGKYAFYYCKSLTSINIPSSVTSIGSNAFSNCTSLGDVYISDMSAWCNISFSNANSTPFCNAENLYLNNELVTDLVITEGVTSLNNYAFYSCDSITSVTMPDSITSMGTNVFSGCTNLTSVDISDSITTIPNKSFYNCTALADIKLPVSVTIVESYAFDGCTSLSNVYYGGDKADRGAMAFNDYNTTLTNATWTYNYCEHISTSVVTPPTCTAQGYTTYTCQKCGLVYTDDYVDALGHSYGEWRIILPADCENSGSHSRICSVCGNVETAVIPAIGHNYVETVVPPTCTEDGYTQHVCLNCNDTYTDTPVDAIGHNYVETVVPPTCTEEGYTQHVCSNCNDIYKEDYVDALGHSFGEWIITSESTCTEAGSKYRVCSACDLTEYEDIAVLAHTYADEWTIDEQPNCTQNGSKSHHCTVCGHRTDITLITAYGHAYDSWKYESVPTCTVAGKIVCSCLLCGDKKTITIEPYGHEFSDEWTVDIKPTCIEVGIKSNHCIRCSVVNNETEIDALGHSYTDVTVEPTCTAEGYTEHICSICGDFYQTDFVNANGHTLTHFEQLDATCTTGGYEAYDVCSVCGYTTYQEIEALGHNYQATDDGMYTCLNCDTTVNGNAEHTYVKTIVKATDEQDGYTLYTCTDCGYCYKSEETQYTTEPKLSITDSIVGAGKTVILYVSISDNPGIYSFTLGVDYDTENMTLTEIRSSGTLGGEFSSSNNKVLWLNNTKEDSYYNGEIFQLVFTVSAHAVVQDYGVSLTYNAGNIVNYSLEDVNLAVEQGVITVENFTAGDLNSDGRVDNKDLILMSELYSRRYITYHHGKPHHDKHRVHDFNLFDKHCFHELKNYDIVVLGVTIERVALDINNDGVINNHDLLTMMKYLRGEEVTIW